MEKPASIELDTGEVLKLAAVILPIAVLIAVLGAAYCYFTSAGLGCYSSEPFIYSLLGLTVLTVFYYLGLYLELVHSCVTKKRSVKLTISDVYHCCAQAFHALRIDISIWYDELLAGLTGQEKQEFDRYEFEAA